MDDCEADVRTRANGNLSLPHLNPSDRIVVEGARRLLATQLPDASHAQYADFMLELLVSWEVGATGIAAALLIPLLRQDYLKTEALVNQFGQRIVHTAQQALGFIQETQPGSSHADMLRLRDLMICAYTNVEVVLLCVAEHLAAASILEEQNTEVRQRWAQKNTTIFLSLLEMLGMWAYRRDLGNLSLALLNMPYYEQLEHSVGHFHQQVDPVFNLMCDLLREALGKHRLHGEIAFHYATPINIHLHRQQVKRRGAPDGSPHNPYVAEILRIDVTLETEAACYQALGIIHGLWQPSHRSPNGGRFRDFIAMPRFNGYRCLLTTVLYDVGQGKQPVEFRLLTPAMREINDYGIVAAMMSPQTVKNAWWNDLTRAEVVSPQATRPDRIGVFTPSGEMIYPLRRGSTVVDLAFRVHSSLGPYAQNFRVNGRQVDYAHVLKHCDLVDIEYASHHPTVEPEWLPTVVTSTAQSNIRRFLHRQNRSANRGQWLISKVLARETAIYQMRFPQQKCEQTLLKIARRMHCSSVDQLYTRVSDNVLAPDVVVAAMIEAELVGHIVMESGVFWPANRIRIARTWMQRPGAEKWSKVSRVMPGCAIVGRLRGKPGAETLLVYRQDDPLAPAADAAIPLRWRGTNTVREAVELTIIGPRREGVTGEVLSAVYAVGAESSGNHVILESFHADSDENSRQITLVVDADSMDSIERLQALYREMQAQGRINEVKVWQLFPGQKMMLANGQDRRAHNPFTLRRIRNRDMFFGRENEINSIIEQINDGQMFIVLYGQKRIGKTSILHQLVDHVLPKTCDVLPVFLDLHSVLTLDPVHFLVALAEAAENPIRHKLQHPERARKLRLREQDLHDEPFQRFAGWVRTVEKNLQGTRLLFVVDEFTRAEEEFHRDMLDPGFFDGIQWLVGDRNIGFLLCVHDNVYHQESQSWGMMQRGYPLRLDTLDYDAASRLIQQPLERLYKLENDVVERIVHRTHGHPYFLHAIGQELISRMRQEALDCIETKHVEAATAAVLKNGNHFFSHFRGAVDELSWSMLKVIAYIAGDGNGWVERDAIRQAMEEIHSVTSGWRIADSLSQLYRAGLVEARRQPGKVHYRIQISLFQFWLYQGTHPLIRKDLQRED